MLRVRVTLSEDRRNVPILGIGWLEVPDYQAIPGKLRTDVGVIALSAGTGARAVFQNEVVFEDTVYPLGLVVENDGGQLDPSSGLRARSIGRLA